jgi:uncharacterized membrane protein
MRRTHVSITSDHARPGRAWHPPFTDFPIAAYVFAAAFDVISAIGGPHRPWALQFWHAGTFVLVAGVILCLLTMVTGFADLLRYSRRQPGATRTAVLHAMVMTGVFMIGAWDVAWRISEYHRQASTPAGILLVSLAAAAGVGIGAAHGGSLVFRYGVGVQADGPPAPAPVRPHAALMPGQVARHRSRRSR